MSTQLLRGGAGKGTRILLTLKYTMETTFPTTPKDCCLPHVGAQNHTSVQLLSRNDHSLNVHLHHQIIHQMELKVVNALKKNHWVTETEFRFLRSYSEKGEKPQVTAAWTPWSTPHDCLCSDSHFYIFLGTVVGTDGLVTGVLSALICAAGASQNCRNSNLLNNFSCHKQVLCLL